MYSAELTISRVQKEIKSKKLVQKVVLNECGVSENTLKRMSDNGGMASFNLARIADHLDCSVDYLLGRTDNPNSHKEKAANTVSGNYNAVDNSSVTIGAPILDEHQKLLIELYNKLPPIKQVELISSLNKNREEGLV